MMKGTAASNGIGIGKILLLEEVSLTYTPHAVEDPQAEIDRFKDSPSPAIIVIPGREGSSGLGLQALKAAVERAVGTNILGD